MKKENQFVLKNLIVLISVIILTSANPLSAQEKEWKFTAAPYVLLPYMSGDIQMRDLPVVEVDATAGDIFSNLDFGAMFYFEANNNNWAFSFDGLYMNLGADGEMPLTRRAVDVDLKQYAVTFNALKRITPWAELGVGGRFNSIKAGLGIASGEILPGRNPNMDQSWFDPLLVARIMTYSNNEKWRFASLFDIGGFGIGSDFEWQIYPVAGYRFSDLFELALAYRWLGMKYETGSGAEFFLYDMVISGPEIGFLFHF